MAWHGGVDLMAAYAAYLAVALAVGIAFRARYYYVLLNVFMDFRNRFPKLFRLAVGHVHLFLAWPHVLSVAAGLFVLATHWIAFQVVFTEASLTVSDLAGRPTALATVAVLGAAMLAMDVHALFIADRPDPPRVKVYLFLAEKALATAGPVSLVSRGVIGTFLRRKILNATLVVNPWFRLWMARTVVRIVFGLALWWTWGAVGAT